MEMHGKLFFPLVDLSRARAYAPIRKDALGECDKKTTFEILDFFYEQGGNFIDTYEPHFRRP